MAEKRVSIGAKRNPETEAAILDAAAQIVAEKGIGKFSIEAVARRARAGKASIYRWWPSRGALLMAVYQRNRPQDRWQDTGTLEEDLSRFLAALFNHWSQPPGALFRHILAAAQSDADLAEAVEAFRQSRVARVRQRFFERAEARGEVDLGGQGQAMAEMFIAQAWAQLMLGQTDRDPAETVRLLLQGWIR